MGYNAERCIREASHMISGKPYCGMHAGIEALRILEGMK